MSAAGSVAQVQLPEIQQAVEFVVAISVELDTVAADTAVAVKLASAVVVVAAAVVPVAVVAASPELVPTEPAAFSSFSSQCLLRAAASAP